MTPPQYCVPTAPKSHCDMGAFARQYGPYELLNMAYLGPEMPVLRYSRHGFMS